MPDTPFKKGVIFLSDHNVFPPVTPFDMDSPVAGAFLSEGGQVSNNEIMYELEVPEFNTNGEMVDRINGVEISHKPDPFLSTSEADFNAGVITTILFTDENRPTPGGPVKVRARIIGLGVLHFAAARFF